MARVGIHCGAIVGGLVGKSRIRFAVFGDAVNTAQRLEAGSEPGKVTVSAEVADALRSSEDIALVDLEPIPAKGKGMLEAWQATRSSRGL